MEVKLESQWERIFKDGNWTTWRMKVPGGWLVNNSTLSSEEDGIGDCLCFFPDPMHVWDHYAVNMPVRKTDE